MTKEQLPHRIHVREVGPREGFQMFPTWVPTADKLRLIESLSHSGVEEIEVASFVRADRVPQLADAEALVSALPQVTATRFVGLYLNTKGFERAEATGRLHNRGWLYTSPSDTFLKSNANTTIEATISDIPRWSALFKRYHRRVYGLMVSNAFGCAYEGEISTDAVVALVERFQSVLAAEGERIEEVCLADTVGLANPRSIKMAVEVLVRRGFVVSLHLHDTRGLGIANAYAGLQSGVRTFETAIGGIGGCPFTPGAAGNIATEDFVYLCHSLGIETGIDLHKLCTAAHLVSTIMGQPLPGRVYKTFKPANAG